VKSYLDRLAARLVEPRSHIRPRPLSRFELADAPSAFVEEVGMAGEEDTVPAPPTRAQPMRAMDDRDDGIRQFASTTLPLLRAEAIATPEDPHPASITTDIPAAPSTLDAPAAEARDVRAPSRRDPASLMAEPVEAPLAHRLTSNRAMPASVEALPPGPGATVTAASGPKAQDPIAPPGIEDRISPWRAPAERPAEPAIDTRSTTQGPIPAAMPQQRDNPAAAVDDTPAVVQITIGRLEVRAPETPRRPSAKPARAAPRMSLQDYLQRRTEGRSR